jgi:hypothetical protein
MTLLGFGFNLWAVRRTMARSPACESEIFTFVRRIGEVLEPTKLLVYDRFVRLVGLVATTAVRRWSSLHTMRIEKDQETGKVGCTDLYSIFA